MWRISKQFTFSAGHALTGLPEGHKCGRPHGHNYVAEARIGAPDLDARGFVIDYGDLAAFGRWLDGEFDHQWLGAGPVNWGGYDWEPAVDFNPTAELLAAHMRDWLVKWFTDQATVPVLLPVEVAVSETGKTWAWVS